MLGINVFSVQFSLSVVSEFATPLDCSTPGFPVHHQFLELAQSHVHRLCDAIQPSHPLSSPSPPAFYLSQHWGIFQWVNSLHQVAKLLKLLFSIIPSNEYPELISLRLTGWISLLSKGLSRLFSNTTVQKHQLSGIQVSLWSNSHFDTWLLEKPYLCLDGPLSAK